jgi:hypothetical protein
MWLDNEYFVIYLFGCALVFILTILKVLFVWMLAWFKKENILKKNLKKIAEPDDLPIWRKWVGYIFGILLESALSWINVVVILVQFIYYSFRYAREVFTTVPEEIKLLRFPLYNNPNMTRETIWAYMYALGVKAGNNHPNEGQLKESLDELLSYYGDFDRTIAIKELDDLKVISSDTLDSVITNIESEAERAVIDNIFDDEDY